MKKRKADGDRGNNNNRKKEKIEHKRNQLSEVIRKEMKENKQFVGKSEVEVEGRK